MIPSAILSILIPLLPALLQGGGIIASQFPNVAGVVGSLSQINLSDHTSPVALVQDILNALQAAGVINFGAPLKVDGEFGGATFAAIKVLQTKMGVAIEEPLASLEYNFLQQWLPKI